MARDRIYNSPAILVAAVFCSSRGAVLWCVLKSWWVSSFTSCASCGHWTQHKLLQSCSVSAGMTRTVPNTGTHHLKRLRLKRQQHAIITITMFWYIWNFQVHHDTNTELTGTGRSRNSNNYHSPLCFFPPSSVSLSVSINRYHSCCWPADLWPQSPTQLYLWFLWVINLQTCFKGCPLSPVLLTILMDRIVEAKPGARGASGATWFYAICRCCCIVGLFKPGT